ncbi:MAG: prepilin-type N-terminal cleavage/methylation domain-containing protein [Planctomycetota bacterium]
MNRRGFTLVETVLAMVVGSLILAAALGVLVTVEENGRALGEHARGMNDLALVQQVTRDAMANLHVAPAGVFNRAVRGGQGVPPSVPAVDAAAEAGVFPEPPPGLSHRFEMTSKDGRPRLEIVVRRPLMGPPPARPEGLPDAVLTAADLPAHRGAFELRSPERGGEGRRRPARTGDRDATMELWWVPLPPIEMPEGVSFDEGSLPPPARLARGIDRLTWTSFIDSQRVPRVRAFEASQLPAFIELELGTATGAYGNWTFELGFSAGPDVVSPLPPADALDAEATPPALDEQDQPQTGESDEELSDEVLDSIRESDREP